MLEPVRQVYLQNRPTFEALYRSNAFDPRHHQRALEAIERGDAEAAASAMADHASTAPFGKDLDVDVDVDVERGTSSRGEPR
jgi:DNA-binding GntR family transcriptional regulator